MAMSFWVCLATGFAVLAISEAIPQKDFKRVPAPPEDPASPLTEPSPPATKTKTQKKAKVIECKLRKSEKACQMRDGLCRWDFLHKMCANVDCHSYDDDLPQCQKVSYCVNGIVDDKNVCFSDDCHTYGPEPKKKNDHQFYSGPPLERENYCQKAPHCYYQVVTPPGDAEYKPYALHATGTTWACTWKDCSWYNHQLTAKAECNGAVNCNWDENGGSCIDK